MGEPRGEPAAHDSERLCESVVRRLYDEVWNAGRDEVAAELFDPDFETVAAHGLRGGASKLAVIRGYRAAFPDVHIEVDDLVAGSGEVAVRWTLTGTDTGGFRGHEPTGRRVSGWGVEFFRFRDNRIVTNWVGADWLGVLVQLGLTTDPWARSNTVNPPVNAGSPQ